MPEYELKPYATWPPPNEIRGHTRRRRTVSSTFRETLETFENPYPNRDYVIETVCPEFTSVCPKTGQPDFGTLTITYTPDQHCVELKSLKLYLQQFRNEGIFYERVSNRILDDLVAVTQPRWMQMVAAFTPRGGLSSTVRVSHGTPPSPLGSSS